MATFDDVRAMAAELPATEEYTCFGTAAFRVKKKLMVRLKEDGTSLVVKTEEKEALLASNPKVYYTTSHYDGYPMVLVRLPKVGKKELRELLTDAWRIVAPKRLLAEFDAAEA